MRDLDSPDRYSELRATLMRKGSLRMFYGDIYREYRACLARCPAGGTALELGSGAGFVKESIPQMVTSDVVRYEGVDRVIEAGSLPYPDRSLSLICMTNVFHHIGDVGTFLAEAERVLMPGGRVLIADQHIGLLSRFILKYLHHEPCDPAAREWSFPSSGPLSDANGALAWIVFRRDCQRFRTRFPGLQMVRYQPHAPLRYWLAGGLKRWSLLPAGLYGAARALDRMLVSVSAELGSFVFVELVKKGAAVETTGP